MGILKVAHRNRFTTVDRATVRDVRLSFRALGLLVRLLDQPDDAEVDSARLADHRPEGREAVRTALRELETCGYLRRERRQVEKGRWVTITWVYERPPADGAQQGELPGTDSATTAQGAPGQAGAGQARVGAPGAQNEKPAGANAPAKRAAREAAHGIVGRVYRARDPKPATPFTTAVGIVERLLLAGHDANRVELALGTVATVSLGSVERELTGRRGSAVGKPVEQVREGESGRVALL